MDDTCLYTLVADTVTSEDAGTWRCELVNPFGRTSATCTIRVFGKYYFPTVYFVMKKRNTFSKEKYYRMVELVVAFSYITLRVNVLLYILENIIYLESNS